MKRGNRRLLRIVFFVYIAIMIYVIELRSNRLSFIFLVASFFPFLILMDRAGGGWSNHDPWAGFRTQVYQPRPTDAGHWVAAPIAEVDKSTFGKLLASRMRREPGLNVVVRGSRPETPPIGCDAPLYDAELDGRP